MRYVLTPDAISDLAEQRRKVHPEHRLLAPTLMRSEFLSTLFQSVKRGEFDRREADARLAHVRSLNIRLLGDRVLQRRAWDIALELGWDDTLLAEYVALTQLQADALVTMDSALARTARRSVTVAAIEALNSP